MAFLTKAANRGSIATGYEIENSALFEASTDDRLYLNPAGASADQKKFTFSTWFKVSGNLWNRSGGTDFSGGMLLFSAGNGSSEQVALRLSAEYSHTGGSYYGALQTDIGQGGTNSRSVTRVGFRDPTAWYHVCWAVDTTQSTATDRSKLWVNGILLEIGDTTIPNAYYSRVNPAQNFDTSVGEDNVIYQLGCYLASGNYYSELTGYLAETHFIHGTAYDQDDFGEFAEDCNNTWIPKRFSGSYGRDGFYMKYDDSSQMGKDSSGNGNNLANGGNMGSSRISLDTPTNNFCSLGCVGLHNSQYLPSHIRYGGTRITGPSSQWTDVRATIPVSEGKWYWEVQTEYSGGNVYMIGVRTASYDEASYGNNAHDINEFAGLYLANSGSEGGYFVTDDSGGSVYRNAFNPGASHSANDVYGIALDMDNGTITFYKNGSNINPNSGAPLSLDGLINGSGPSNNRVNYIVPCISLFDARVANFNFGSWYYSGSNTNADENGYGGFRYSVPSGYYAICTKNIAEFDAPAIDNPGEYFNTTYYTGTGTTGNSITWHRSFADLQPDILINKGISVDTSWFLTDSSRGVTKGLYTDGVNAEVTSSNANKDVTSFDTNGFTVGEPEDANSTNQTGATLGAMGWKVNGGTTTSNTNGSVTTTVQANQTAGISIVQYTSPDPWAAMTFGHGLAQKPQLILIKQRSAARGWRVYWEYAGASKYAIFESNAAFASLSTVFGNTEPTNSIVTLGTHAQVNYLNETHIAYCFHSVKGLRHIGVAHGDTYNYNSYYVHTGFRPKIVMLKRYDGGTDDWHVKINDWDRQDYYAARHGFNPTGTNNWRFNAATKAQADTNYLVEFYATGFKIRTINGSSNQLDQYLFWAEAERPMVTSTGIPATAG